MSATSQSMPPLQKGSPPWVIATLFPPQGTWSEGEYLDLGERTNRLIELSDGCVEVLDLPTKKHQLIVQFLYRALFAFLDHSRLGQVMVAPYPLRVWQGQFREPDVLAIRAERAASFEDRFATAADLVVEVLSEDRTRDLETKPAEYAQAAIPEYWIVDPRDRRITVFRLDNGAYVAAGEYRDGQQACSIVLSGFQVDVTAALDAK
jgi:Uma2 family endonuclease